MKYILLFLVLLVSCKSDKSYKKVEHSGHTRNEFPGFKSQHTNKEIIAVIDESDTRYRLDSMQYVNWTDKYTPVKSNAGRNFHGEIYSVQPPLVNYAVLVIRTQGDHWYKLHLISLNEDLTLVDNIKVSDNWAELIEQAGDTEVVGKQSMYTKMVNGKEYWTFDIRTTEVINYYTDSTTYEIDSVVTKIELLTNGFFKLTKLDSIRTLSRSANQYD